MSRTKAGRIRSEAMASNRTEKKDFVKPNEPRQSRQDLSEAMARNRTEKNDKT